MRLPKRKFYHCYSCMRTYEEKPDQCECGNGHFNV